jgi:hypothetical protein
MEGKMYLFATRSQMQPAMFAEFMFSFCGHDGVGSTMCPVLIFLFFILYIINRTCRPVPMYLCCTYGTAIATRNINLYKCQQCNCNSNNMAV